MARRREPLTREAFDRLRDAAINAFDFNAAARAYEVLGWRWSRIDRSPNADELRENAMCLFETVFELHARDGKCWHSASGGLTASATDCDEGFGVALEFVAVYSHADPGHFPGDVHAYSSKPRKREMPEVPRD